MSVSSWTPAPEATFSPPAPVHFGDAGTAAGTPQAVTPAAVSSMPQISPTPVPTIEPPSPTPKTCSDSLNYLADLNYPDRSLVSPGKVIEKQWRVENNGSCNWDGRYRLKLQKDSAPLGAAGEMALYPARAGTQATISINFSAPLEAGTYRTAWQAYNPEGLAFGDVVYMLIIVKQ